MSHMSSFEYPSYGSTAIINILLFQRGDHFGLKSNVLTLITMTGCTDVRFFYVGTLYAFVVSV